MTQLYIPCEYANYCASHYACGCLEACPACGAPKGHYNPACAQCQECREDARETISVEAQFAEACL